MAITAYEFVRTNGHDRLNDLIAEKISGGYEPFGPLILFDGGDVGQAVIAQSPPAPTGSVITAQPDIADIADAPDETDFNGLLAMLRSAGVLIETP